MVFTLGELIAALVVGLLAGTACTVVVICACVQSSKISRAEEKPAIEGDSDRA